MKRMNELKGRLQYLTTMASENEHLQEGHLCPGIKISFLVYVMPAIIMVIKLYIVEHIFDMNIIGAETNMKIPKIK